MTPAFAGSRHPMVFPLFERRSAGAAPVRSQHRLSNLHFSLALNNPRFLNAYTLAVDPELDVVRRAMWLSSPT
jgi:hypothetical protein